MAKKPAPTSPNPKRAGGQRPGTPAPGRSTGRTGPLAQNRRARHDYEILDSVECGIMLAGSEIKSIRAGAVQLADAYVRIDRGEAWLVGAHVAPYAYAQGAHGGHDPTRSRKLLLHRRQIDELAGKVAQKSLTIVPLSIYLRDGRAKVEIALARGRALYDRRRAIAERDAKREMERAVSLARSGKVTRSRP